MRGNQTGGSKTDTMIKLVLIFFISLLSFSVGTFVGKQVSDSDYKRAALEEDYKSFRNASNSKGRSEKESDDNLENAKVSSEELKSLTDEFVNAEKEQLEQEKDLIGDDKGETKKTTHALKQNKENKENLESWGNSAKREPTAATHETKKEKEQPSVVASNNDGYKKYSKEKSLSNSTVEAKSLSPNKKEKSAKESSISTEANRVAEGKAPTADDKKENRRPASVLPSVASSSIGKYTIQVASYVNEEEAKTHANELKQKGWNAFYVPAELNSKTWYRVSIGLFTDQKSAMNFREELMKQSAISTAIIQKIVQ